MNDVQVQFYKLMAHNKEISESERANYKRKLIEMGAEPKRNVSDFLMEEMA